MPLIGISLKKMKIALRKNKLFLECYLQQYTNLSNACNPEEKQTIYTMLDAFIGKRKLKNALSNVLTEVK